MSERSLPTVDDDRPAPPAPRRVAGRYRLLGVLGRGGSATVHRALDERLDRVVAVKLLHPHLAEDDVVLDRFEREARAAAAVSHPGIVAVFDSGVAELEDGLRQPYLVMELVEGRTLRDVLRLHGRLTPGQALTLLAPAVEGLAAAHAKGLVHRDVKPENVLLRADGSTCLGDFGLARAVAAATTTYGDAIVGSPHYLSPEAVDARPLDARSDVYALGIVLYELLVGAPPFASDSALATALRHGNERVPAPSAKVDRLGPALDRVVLRATAVDPAERFVDAAAFGRALATALPSGAEPVDLRTGEDHTVVLPGHATRAMDALLPPPPPRPVWHRIATAIGAVMVAVLLAAGGWLGYDRVLAPVTDVPAVVGSDLATARADLRAAGFAPRADLARVFDARTEEGTILRQVPDGAARRGAVVLLTVSAGPRRAQLPQLVGTSIEDARGLLDGLGIALDVQVEEVFDDEVPSGRVAAVTPSGGTVAQGSTVTLRVSAGPQPVEVPDVAGESVSDALARLDALGLDAVEAERRNDDDVPAGAVLGTTPAAGETVVRGDRVGVIVSDGPAPVRVPDVVPLGEEEAIATLQDAGLDVEVIDLPTINPFRSGLDAQDPAPGTTVRRGDTVRIFVWR